MRSYKLELSYGFSCKNRFKNYQIPLYIRRLQTKNKIMAMDMSQKITSLALASVMCITLSGCGTQPADRAISGALMGAAAGGAVFALFPGTPITLGLATGGALGGIVGGLSLPDYIYMGEPAWLTHEFNSENFRFQRRQAIMNNQPQPGMMPPRQTMYLQQNAPQPQGQQMMQPQAQQSPQYQQQQMMQPSPYQQDYQQQQMQAPVQQQQQQPTGR